MVKNNFLSVIAKKQTYLNIAYLLISFFLGLTYFIILTTFISLGLGLLIVWVGIPILLGTIFIWHGMAYVERVMSKTLLNIKIPYVPTKWKKEKSLWKKLKKHLSTPNTWKSLIYLFLKFPLGIISFVTVITLFSISFSFIAIPIIFHLGQLGILNANFCVEGIICYANTYLSASIWGIVGVSILFLTFHILNILAELSGSLAKEMLSKKY